MNNYSLSFKEYLNDAKEKFAAIISKNQYAIDQGKLTHEGMLRDLISLTRPDIEMDSWGNAIDSNMKYVNGNIVLCGYPNYVQIELPEKEMFSEEQFDCLKEILLDIKNKNEELEEKYKLVVFGAGIIPLDGDDYANRIDYLIEFLSQYISDNYIVPDEQIIGEKLDDRRIESARAK